MNISEYHPSHVQRGGGGGGFFFHNHFNFNDINSVLQEKTYCIFFNILNLGDQRALCGPRASSIMYMLSMKTQLRLQSHQGTTVVIYMQSQGIYKGEN